MKTQLLTLFFALQTGMNLRMFWGERAIHCTLNAETKVKVEDLFPNIDPSTKAAAPNVP